ncbi:MAG TPA: hypothetical protein PLM41_06870 [Saprospiraceae bacterium]|nr:hypothetical protein [Saprospiraceae bacterium]
MKNVSIVSALILFFGALGYFGLPWWSLPFIAAIAVFLFPLSGGKSFSVGFAAGSLLWLIVVTLHNMSNGGMLSTKIGQLFMGAKGFHLIMATTFIGGLLAGFGALTGTYARQMLFPAKPKRYGKYR